MLVHALVTSVRTYPEPTVLLVFDCLNEVFAHLVCGGLRVPVFAHDHLAQFLLVPVVHLVLFFLFLLDLSVVRVQTPLLGLPLHGQVMRELAFATLVAVALFEELAEHGLGVDAERNLLHLDGLEKLGRFLLGFLSGLLLPLALQFLGFLLFFGGGFGAGSGLLDIFDLFLCGSALFVFHTKGLHGSASNKRPPVDLFCAPCQQPPSSPSAGPCPLAP